MKLRSIFPEQQLNCDKIRKSSNFRFIERKAYPSTNAKAVPMTNSFILKEFKKYKSNVRDMYKLYENDKEYKKFIDIIEKKTKKENPNNIKMRLKESSNINNPRYDFSNFFDEKERNKINKDFVETLSLRQTCQ